MSDAELRLAMTVAHLAAAQAEVARLKAVLRPLLEHYLNCYDGLEDQLAIDARAALEGK